MLFATPKFAIQGFAAANKLGWKPQVYVASVSIEPNIMAIARLNAPQLTNGALSVAFVKNPNDPIWAKDPALKLYRTIMKRYLPSGKPSDVYNWYGMTVAWTMVETLERAGKNPTRASLLRAAQTLNVSNNPVPVARDRAENVQNTLFPARQGLPLPLRQPAVGQGESAPRRPRVTCHPSFTTLGGTEPMNKAIRTIVLVLVGAFALSSAGTALAAYTTPKLGVIDAKPAASVTINYSVSATDDPTAKLTFYAPKEYTASLTQPAGQTIGTVTAQGTAADLGGALLPLTGTVQVRAANGTYLLRHDTGPASRPPRRSALARRRTPPTGS